MRMKDMALMVVTGFTFIFNEGGTGNGDNSNRS